MGCLKSATIVGTIATHAHIIAQLLQHFNQLLLLVGAHSPKHGTAYNHLFNWKQAAYLQKFQIDNAFTFSSRSIESFFNAANELPVIAK
jgi:hypothetical protein